MAIPKGIRILAFATALIFVFIIVQLSRSSPIALELPSAFKSKPSEPPKKPEGNPHGWTNPDHDPLLDRTGEPAEPLRRINGNNYDADNDNSERISATLLSLVRNEELDDMLSSMADMERTFNHKFNYPWNFFNNVPFSDEFKRKTSAATKAKTSYHLIPAEQWDIPPWINKEIYKVSKDHLESQQVAYAQMDSYHQMCRWNSGVFFHHEALKDFQYYWRVEPNVQFFCDIDYDVFRFMQDHNKTYGFTISLLDNPNTVATLWPHTQKFLADHPEYEAKDNARDWVTTEKSGWHNSVTKGYSTCHFWSNFEIADMNLWRSKAYTEWFEALDRAGGFFYERWGDAPVHSLGVSLFEEKHRIHWFKDIGYKHAPIFNCPNSDKCKGCEAGKFTDGEDWLHFEDCRARWFDVGGLSGWTGSEKSSKPAN